MTPGVILAIDYGQKRLGLALSDEHRMTSRPFATWNRINRRRDLTRLRELARLHGVRRIVVGLPLHLDGGASEMSREAAAFAVRIERGLGIPVEMVDERLSSWEAEQIVAELRSSPAARRDSAREAASASRGRGNTGGPRRALLDHVAAAVILRDYLNRADSAAGSTAAAPAAALPGSHEGARK